MQDIVLCSQLASRHGLLVGLTETKKQSLLFMNRVSIGIVLLKCCKTQVAEPQKNAKQAEFAKQQAKEQ